jgi:hypothetical protein
MSIPANATGNSADARRVRIEVVSSGRPERMELIKERHYCDICDVIFEGEAGKHVNDEHGEDFHSSESMIEFEERHISEVD